MTYLESFLSSLFADEWKLRRVISLLAFALGAIALCTGWYLADDPGHDAAVRGCIAIGPTLLFVGMVAWSEDW